MKINKETLCVVSMPYWHHTLEYGLESVASCGFQNVEFWAASPHYCYADYTAQERKARKQEILAMMKARGLKMPVFAPEQMDLYTLNIASPEAYIQSTSMDRIMEYLEDAVEFGAGAMMLGTGWQYLDDPKEENYQRSIAAVKKIAARAQELGLTLLIEPMGRTSGTFVWDLPTLQQYLKDVNLPNVKACLNTAGILEDEHSLKEWFEGLQGCVGHVHFADKGGKILGMGGADVDSELHLLETLGYDGLVSLNITFRDCCINPDRAVFPSAKWLKKKGFLED